MAKVVVTVDEMVSILDSAETEYVGKYGKVENLLTTEKPQWISMRSKTMPKYVKTGRVSGKTMQEALGVDPTNLYKYSDFGCGLAYDYDTSLLNKMLAEGKTEADFLEYKANAKKSWQVPYNGSKVIRVNPNKPEDGYYWQVELLANNKAKVEYIDMTSDEPKVFTPEQVEEWLPIKKDSGIPDIVRCFKLDSVYSVSAMGNEYSIRKG